MPPTLSVKEALRSLGLDDLPLYECNIDKAFRKASRQLHPDKNNGAADPFLQLTQAKEILVHAFKAKQISEQDFGSRLKSAFPNAQCFCSKCIPSLTKAYECKGCLGGTGDHNCGILTGKTGRFSSQASISVQSFVLVTLSFS